jgi:methylated-DNA-[protein]-cysteine S-methyltransferase
MTPTAATPTAATPTAATSPAATSTTASFVVGTLPTPAGPLSVVVDPDGVVHGAAFGSAEDLVLRIGAARPVPPDALPGNVRDAVARYSAGEVTALESVPVSQPGGAFFQAAWAAMRQIPAGRTLSYTELAAEAGRPLAVRAAASACARNLVAPFVPCHRVLRADGTLGGYAYGLDAKRALLAHERAADAG